MSSLVELSNRLKEHSKILKDESQVTSGIRDILDKMLAGDEEERKNQLKENNRKRKQDEENRRESKTTNLQSKPMGFTAGVLQGTGLQSLFDLGGKGLELLLPIGGLAAISGLLGKAVGRTFVGGAGALLGLQYFTPWLDSKLGDLNVELFKVFDQSIDVAELGGAVGGAVALLFGPKLLKGAITSFFAGGSAAKDGGTAAAGAAGATGRSFRGTFLRRLGLAGIIFSIADITNSLLQADANDEETKGEILNQVIGDLALTSALFGVGGPIGIAAGLAIWGATKLQARSKELRDQNEAEINADIERHGQSISEMVKDGNADGVMYREEFLRNIINRANEELAPGSEAWKNSTDNIVDIYREMAESSNEKIRQFALQQMDQLSKEQAEALSLNRDPMNTAATDPEWTAFATDEQRARATTNLRGLIDGLATHPFIERIINNPTTMDAPAANVKLAITNELRNLALATRSIGPGQEMAAMERMIARKAESLYNELAAPAGGVNEVARLQNMSSAMASYGSRYEDYAQAYAVEARPRWWQLNGFLPSNPKSAQSLWDQQYGDAYNPDGTLKSIMRNLTDLTPIDTSTGGNVVINNNNNSSNSSGVMVQTSPILDPRYRNIPVEPY